MNEFIEKFTEEGGGSGLPRKSERKSREWWQYRLSQTNVESKEQVSYLKDYYKFATENDTRLIAIMILGSTLKGYTNRNSDIDVSLILSIENNDTGVLEHFKQLEKDFREKQNKNISIHIVDTINTYTLDVLVRKPEMANVLVRPGIGQIAEIREKVRHLLKEEQLTQYGKKRWISGVLEEIIKTDLDINNKIHSSGIVDFSEFKNYRQSRISLYRQKIIRIFFPNEDL